MIPENIADTSFDNDKDDFEGRASRKRARGTVGAEQWNIVHVQGDQGMYFNDSDSSDGVSDGPSEKL